MDWLETEERTNERCSSMYAHNNDDNHDKNEKERSVGGEDEATRILFSV